MIVGMVWGFITTIAGDRDLQRLQLGRLDIGDLAAQAVNLARFGYSRFRRFNSRFGRKTSRLSAYGNSPISACLYVSFSLRISACWAKIVKIPVISGSTGIWPIAVGPRIDPPDRPEAGVWSPYRLTSSSSAAPRRARSGPVESR